MIILEPIAGLCNRMGSIDSAISLGKQLGKDVCVLWSIDQGLNCAYDRLFVRSTGIKYLFQLKFPGLLNRMLRYAIFHSSKFFCDKVLLSDEIFRLFSQGYDFNELRAYKNIYLLSWSRFMNTPDLARNFIPTEPLLKTINSYAIDGNTIGVHIRRADHWESILHSPSEIFIEKLHQEVKENDRVTFFVASDSIEEKRNLRDIFPDRVITRQLESVDRNKPAAIQDALIDLYCLSNCRKIIGSFDSSFTDVAHQLKRIPYEVVDSLRID